MTSPAPDPAASPVRPMTAADYAGDVPLRQARAPAQGEGPHATRDLIVGAVAGAAALWAVPKILDALADRFTGQLWERDDGGELETDLYE
jgi:hypothetical protein